MEARLHLPLCKWPCYFVDLLRQCDKFTFYILSKYAFHGHIVNAIKEDVKLIEGQGLFGLFARTSGSHMSRLFTGPLFTPMPKEKVSEAITKHAG